jgi:DNA-binding NarL/FixJ family response regulator
MGFLTKSSPTEVFHSALNLVLLGNIYIPPQALAAMKGTHGTSAPQPSPLPTLSPRETAVFNALIEGQSNKLIARNLDIAEQTVKFHVSNILKALKVTNRTQAVIVAARLGFKVSLRRSAAEVCSEVASEVGPR